MFGNLYGRGCFITTEADHTLPLDQAFPILLRAFQCGWRRFHCPAGCGPSEPRGQRGIEERL